MILITGGAGFIGSHICVELLNEGHDVAIIDNLSNSRKESLTRVEEITGGTITFYENDLLDRSALEEIFSKHTIEAVIHMAGLKSVNDSVSLPLTYYKNNLTATFVLLEVMAEFNVKTIIFSSSATVYGKPASNPITEDFPVSAINPYGRTKLMIEEVLADLWNADSEWSISILRYFNPIGAHPSGKIGESPNGTPNNLMPYVAKVALGQYEKLTVYGDDYPTVDGTGVRDYIHVTDLALGHVKALSKAMQGSGHEIYNLGTGEGYSVLQLVRAFESASGRSVPYEVTGRREGDVASCYANPSKAEEKLGWKAEKTITDMCEDTWRWRSHNPYGYASGE
ncbi:UDP-glucose 4-epimerase GalE [Salimicrobium jeotgali]|uniref:UDP-glucose 4-epimerase GalE n=1 Tax=Salimicrobium jeotgali TaxID=1230341 RepID=UPI000C844C48|nr:UDP-glucose 4-epimerase GalE [Salimicrobium jeotgali]